MRINSLATLAAIGLISASLDANAASAVAFGPAQWGTSDAVLGVTGYVVEDFEDTSLAAGLEVQVLPPSLSGYGPTSTLPFTFNPAVDDQVSNAFVGSAWDGSKSLVNRPFLPITTYGNDGGWSDVRFLFDAGVTSVGFSIQQARGQHRHQPRSRRRLHALSQLQHLAHAGQWPHRLPAHRRRARRGDLRCASRQPGGQSRRHCL
jgi:hypothetical protein